MNALFLPIVVAPLWLVAPLSAQAVPDDWPRYQDPHRTGSVGSIGVDFDWSSTGPEELWGIPIGPGYGGVAVRDGEVDVITAYTTDGRIAAFDLLILEDPESVFPPYDAIVLLAPGMADDKGLIEALSPLLNRIGNQAMREANRRVDLDRQIPKQAGEYLYRLIGE